MEAFPPQSFLFLFPAILCGGGLEETQPPAGERSPAGLRRGHGALKISLRAILCPVWPIVGIRFGVLTPVQGRATAAGPGAFCPPAASMKGSILRAPGCWLPCFPCAAARVSCTKAGPDSGENPAEADAGAKGCPRSRTRAQGPAAAWRSLPRDRAAAARPPRRCRLLPNDAGNLTPDHPAVRILKP